MTKEQIKKIAQIVESIVDKKLNESSDELSVLFQAENFGLESIDLAKIAKLLKSISKNGSQKSFSQTSIVGDFVYALDDDEEKTFKSWLAKNGLQIMYKSNGSILFTANDFNSY